MTATIEIENLTKKFETLTALKKISLNIENNGITGIVGSDGAGKTTLLRLIAGLYLPTEGNIKTLGFEPYKYKDKINNLMGYMPQKFGLYEDLSVIENLELYADLKEIPKKDRNIVFDKLLNFTSLSPFKKRFAGKLSGGMKQKLGLICALLGSPELLVLDEPSVGVDPISRRELMQMVKELTGSNVTTVWSTSYLDEAHTFDNCIVLNAGKIIYNGSPKALSETPQGFEEEIIKLMGGLKEEKIVFKDIISTKKDIKYTVEADCLEKKYGDFYAVKNNTFCIKKGEIFGLLGPNGAGKSTSFKMMCGLISPSAGTAKIMGVDINENPVLARSYIGYMAQKFSLYSKLDVIGNLKFFSSIYGLSAKKQKEEISRVVEIFELEPYLKQNTGELSLGFKQRLALAAAIMHNPPVLFLDEATSGVDPVGRKEFWNHIRSLSKSGVTVMITTHFMEEAEYCDRISLFFKGETIATGTPAELKNKANAGTMEETFIKLIGEKENG